MKHLSILLCFALTLVAVPGFAEDKNKLDQLFEDAAKAAGMIKDRGKPRQVDKTKFPQIIIKGSEVRYNGQVLKFGDTFVKWESVLGKSSRFTRSIYTWDNLGVIVYLKGEQRQEGWRNTNKISEMVIYLNFKPKDPFWDGDFITTNPDGTPSKPPPDFKPKKSFPGYLEIDGAGVDRTSKVWEVNANKNMFGDPAKHRFRRAHLPTIYSALTPPPELHMQFNTDEKGQEGTIYKFTIN